MKRHILFSSALAAAFGACVMLGHHFGRRRGEAAVAARFEDQVHAFPDRPAGASPARPPAPGAAGFSAPKRVSKNKEEMQRVLADLKSLMFGTPGGKGNISAAFNDTAVVEMLDTLGPDEVRLALGLVAEMPPGMDRTGFSVALMSRWAREDGAGAMEHFRDRRDDAGTFGTLWLTAIMMSWMEKEPVVAARELAAPLKNEEDDILQGSINNTVFMAAEKLAQRDPDAALRHVADLPEWAHESARSAVAKQVHGDGREAFLESIKAMPEGSDKTAWQSAAAIAMAPVDAAGASKWIDSLGLGDEDQRESTRAVFEKWKQHDPRAALEWAAARLPEGERAVLMTHTVESWAAREPNECGRWLGGFEPGPQTDQAVAAFARSVSKKDPESARAWAERITDPGLREQSLRRLAP